MSVYVIAAVWRVRRHVPMTGGDLLTLLRGADWAAHDGSIQGLSHARIGADTGMTRIGTRKIVDRIVNDHGFWRIEEAAAGTRPARYRIAGGLLATVIDIQTAAAVRAAAEGRGHQRLPLARDFSPWPRMRRPRQAHEVGVIRGELDVISDVASGHPGLPDPDLPDLPGTPVRDQGSSGFAATQISKAANTRLSLEPAADGNYSVIEKGAHLVLDGVGTTEPSVEQKEALKQWCADNRIVYGGDVVDRALASATAARKRMAVAAMASAPAARSGRG